MSENMATLKISSLSSGDWVRYKGKEYTIASIYMAAEGYPHMVALTYQGVSCGCTYIDHLDPIPLTSEILEKNGLEYVDDGNDAVIFLCCDMFWARLCVGDTFWQVGIHREDRLDAVVCAVKHTHQLQHALRLAGVDKEINL